MPCGAHTSGKCTSQLVFPSFHRPLVALSSPHLILFLFTLIEHVLLVFLLPALVVTHLSIVCSGSELGIQVELALDSVENSSHRHKFLIIERFGSPSFFGLVSI
jgi:hypothetical protein